MIRFAVLDDHPLVVQGLQSLFQNDTQVSPAWGTTSPEECARWLVEQPVHVLLLDIHLDGADGLQLLRQFGRDVPELRILMLTSYAEPALVKTALHHGAAGYLLKNAGYDEIVAGLLAACRGEQYLPQRLRDILLADTLGQPSRTTTYLPALTPRETDVLKLIVAELTTLEIAEKLFITPKTVETHRMNLLQKLGVRNTAGLVRYALEKGLV